MQTKPYELKCPDCTRAMTHYWADGWICDHCKFEKQVKSLASGHGKPNKYAKG